MISRFIGPFRFLSNFYSAVVRFDDEEYPTVEHAYQAAKTLDLEWRRAVKQSFSPGAAKRRGRMVPLRRDWEAVKQMVMLDLLRQKFADPQLKKLLLDTGEQPLLEGNTWHDNYWGSCLCVQCDNSGENRLGRLLEWVRAELRGSAGADR